MDRFAEDMLNGKPIECAVNPMTCHEKEERKLMKNGDGRKVIIIGAGVSGLYAAKILAQRGFNVSVYEKSDQPGGQINLADKPPCKSRIHWCVKDLMYQATAAGAAIHYSAELNAEDIISEDPYAVLLATGSSEIVPKIRGTEQDFVTTVAPVLDGTTELHNKKIAVIGSGMTGLETAELLLEKDSEITVVEMADRIAPGISGINAQEIKNILSQGNVTFMPGMKLEEIGNHSVTLRSAKDGSVQELKTDIVVLSLGVRADHSLFESLKNRERVFEIGTAAVPGRIAEAIRSAHETAVTL